MTNNLTELLDEPFDEEAINHFHKHVDSLSAEERKQFYTEIIALMTTYIHDNEQEYQELLQKRSLGETSEEKEQYDRLEAKHLALHENCLKVISGASPHVTPYH